MLSPSLEDYLEEVYRLSFTKKEIRIKDIAKCLNVSNPSVVKGLKKLHEGKYILYVPYEKIKLLDKGNREGKFLFERNKLLRKFIVTIGSNSDENKEAESMEHYLTIDTIKCIEKLLLFFHAYPEIYNHFKQYEFKSRFD